MPGVVAAGARRHVLPVSSARADFVASGLAARPGQGPVPAEQDLREALDRDNEFGARSPRVVRPGGRAQAGPGIGR